MSLEAKELFCRPTDERILLSYCMKDLSYYYEVCAKLASIDFLYSQHEILMMLLHTLAAKGSEKFDVDLISSEALANNIMDDIGGLKYLQTIANIKASDKNFNIHLGEVLEAASKYKLYNILNDNIEELKDNAKAGIASADMVGQLESNIMDLSTSGLNISDAINLADGLSEFIEEKRNNRVEISGLPTGFPILDRQIDGLIPGTLMVVAARKKMGKSALLTNIATNVAYNQKVPVLYIDTELTYNEWRTRALAGIARVKERDIKHGGYDDFTYSKLKKAERIINGGKLFHEYMPGYSVDKLVALYKKYKHKENIGLIVFDYLKEPESSSVDRQRKEYQILGDVTTKIKDLAGQLGIPALTAVQLNRDNDVADSDRVARYADVICHWGKREREELDAGGDDCGTHKLVIKDTRRGGATNKEGIGYIFFQDYLGIKEVMADKQYFIHSSRLQNEDNVTTGVDYADYEEDDLR